MASQIHSTAVIDPAAEIGTDVVVGPYCVVGKGVTLGDACELASHVVIEGPSIIGARNRFHSHAVIGGRTQDLKYVGEPTYLEIGDENTFREFCTIHRSDNEESVTRIGSGGNFLAYSHIAHDCQVGDGVIFSNNGTLAGHVTVGDHAIIGGLTAVHQFCRIGRHAITGGCSKIVQDVPPFTIADGNPAVLRGLNKIGLQRHGFPDETVRALRSSYRTLFRSPDLDGNAALDQARAEGSEQEEVTELVDFIASSERGVIRRQNV